MAMRVELYGLEQMPRGKNRCFIWVGTYCINAHCFHFIAMWYNLNKTLSYNAALNLIIGVRGVGKTYTTLKRCLEDFDNKGNQLVYVKRTKEDLKKTKGKIFDQILVDKGEPPSAIKVKGNTLYRNGKEMGYCVDLKSAQQLKGVAFPFVTWIVFDEFIIREEDAGQRYLHNEAEKFIELYDSIARNRTNVRAMLLANSISFINPYTSFWNFTIPYGKNYALAQNGSVLLELVMGDADFIAMRKESAIGGIMYNTDYEKMSLYNKFYQDTETFIEKKGAGAKYVFTFEYEGAKFGFWVNKNKGLYFVSNDIDPYCRLNYAVTKFDHTPNTLLLQSAQQGLFSLITKTYSQGILRFENQKCKKVVEYIVRSSFR